MDKTKNQVDIFNFLRVIALFCVLGVHSKIVISANVPALSAVENWRWYSYTPAWIAMGMFFILSGYLLGKGFYNDKYKTDLNGIINFYLTRLIRILPMYLFFLLISFIFIYPDVIFKLKGEILIPLLTFTYNGIPSFDGIGATWFISTIFQLYLIAPLFYRFFISKVPNNYHLIMLIVIAVLGLTNRIVGLQFLKLDWYQEIYTPCWTNLDYFLIGMLINSLTLNSTDNNLKKWLRPISLIGLGYLIIHTSYLYYHNHFTFYRNYAPTITIIIFAIIIWAYDSKDRVKSAALSFKNVLKNPLRLLDCIGMLSFGLYLYHSNFFAIMPKLLMNPAIFPNHHSNGRILTYTYIYTFTILIIWAAILYFYIEKPSNKYRATMNFDIKLAFTNTLKKVSNYLDNIINARIGGGGKTRS